MSIYVTVDMVRDHIYDRTELDNEIEMDLFFTPEEIQKALASAMRTYNSIPPIGISVSDPEKLPGTTNLFLDGAAFHLIRATLSKDSRNAITYNAGGSTVDLDHTRIKYMSTLKAEYEEAFKTAASDLKVAINIDMAYGQIG